MQTKTDNFIAKQLADIARGLADLGDEERAEAFRVLVEALADIRFPKAQKIHINFCVDDMFSGDDLVGEVLRIKIGGVHNPDHDCCISSAMDMDSYELALEGSHGSHH